MEIIRKNWTIIVFILGLIATGITVKNSVDANTVELKEINTAISEMSIRQADIDLDQYLRIGRLEGDQDD